MVDLNEDFYLCIGHGVQGRTRGKRRRYAQEALHIRTSAVVQRMTGHQVPATMMGEMHVGGRTLVLPASDFNLLSARELTKDNGCFAGNSKLIV